MLPTAIEDSPLPPPTEEAAALPSTPVRQTASDRHKTAWHAPPVRRSNRRRRRMAIGTCLMCLLATGFLWLSALFAPPRAVDFVLLGAAYEQNLSVPHNVYGWNSLTDFAKAIDQGRESSVWTRRFGRQPIVPFRLASDTQLAKVAPPSNSRNWLLFVSAHGGCDQHGAYLIAEDEVNPAKPAHRLRLRDLIDHAKARAAEQHKLIVLDVVHYECDLARGMLINDFATELAKLEDEIAAVPNLVVVCSTRPDQRSIPCSMWGRTTFAHFWIEGLRGAAVDENASGRIDLAELMNYAAGQTTHWAGQYFHATQTPWMLPAGEEGLHRARRIDLAWKEAGYEPSQPSLAAPMTVPAELKAAWQQARDLYQQPVPPYAYQPQAWRHYLAMLARYEELVLCGEHHAAQRVKVDLQALVSQCQRDSTQVLSSLDAERSSSAYSVTVSTELRSRARDVLQLLSSTPEEKWADCWKQQLAAAGVEGQPLRAEVLQMLVDQVIRDPLHRLAPARKLANILRHASQPHGPAMHLIVMIDRDLPEAARTPQTAPLIAQAIRVRQLAEQATTGNLVGFTQLSPRVRPWETSRIAQADLLRQQGEDLLFVGPARYEQSKTLLTTAEGLYRQAIADGQQILNAYAVRDRALSLLPELSTAAAAQPFEQLDVNRARLTADKLTLAWQAVQTLSDGLGDAAQPQMTVADLTQCAQQTALALAGVEAEVSRFWQANADSQASGERLLLGSAPVMPTVDIDLRAQAWDRALQYVRRRHEDLSQLLTLASTGYSFAADDLDKSHSTLPHVQAVAAERGRLALAMLGPQGFARRQHEGSDTWAEAQHRLDVFRVDNQWRDALAGLAEQIASRWQRISQWTIVDTALTDEQADNLGRTLLPQFFTSLNDVASAAVSQRLLSQYLAWQADRAWQDHWYAEQTNETPYYAVRARALLADAQQVSVNHDPFAELAQRIASPDDWDLSAPAQLAATPEELLTLLARLQPMHHAVVTGYVGLKYNMGPGLQCTSSLVDCLAWPQPASSLEVRVQASIEDASQHQTVVPSHIDLEAYFRGRRLTRQVPVSLHGLPEVAVLPSVAPAHGMIAVEVSPQLTQQFGQGHGALAIVLDCSGSMGAKAGQPFDGQTRYAQASAALATVLSNVPRGTQVSLWIFGQAMGPQKTVKDAEKTVRCLRELSPWNPTDAAALQSLVKSFTYPAVEPWNESSVVHAMLSAKDELAKAVGSKSLIVITDGIDNRFQQDREANPQGLDVATGLSEAFRRTGIAINFVGFQIASHEEEAARQQFAVIESFNPPGRFYSVNESAELIAALNGVLDRRLRFWVEDYDHRAVAGETAEGWAPALATSALPRDRIQVNDGEYVLRLAAGKPLSSSIVVGGGDLALARIEAIGQEVSIQRGQVLQRLYPQARRQQSANWNVAILQAALSNGSGALTVASERAFDPSELTLGQITPREVWWELTLDGISPESTATQVTRSYDAGVPAWHVTSTPPATVSLPTATTAQLRGWWIDGVANTSDAQLVAGRDFQRIEELCDRDVNVAGDCLSIRDARWQTDGKTRQLVLVVDGMPSEMVWANITGLGTVTAEHRHYQSLGRYVGIFQWPSSASIGSGYRLEFTTLATLKQTAEERGMTVTFDKVLLSSPVPKQP